MASAQVLSAQDVSGRPLVPATATIRSLIQTRGQTWTTAQSRHFVLHLESTSHDVATTRLLDSLETAWKDAIQLLGTPEPDIAPAHVFVTASRTRFPGLVPPEARGLTTRLPVAGDVIFLIRNDSVRAYTRHEVMHLVARNAWGPPNPNAVWLIEGLATFADGRCQHTTVVATARDILARRPALTADDVVKHFVDVWRAERGTAYALAGSLVDYLWSIRGREGVRRLWIGADSVADVGVLPGSAGPITAGWRSHVVNKAGAARGIAPAALQRFACG